MTEDRHSYRARWLFPVDGDPIENGTVEIECGRIAAVHSRLDPYAEDLGNVALIPGLVNAHTHLEFSHLGEPIGPAHPFTGWIRALVAHRREQAAAPATSIAQGLQECLNCGVTTVGEIATSDEQWDSGKDSQPRVIVFRELLGLRPEQSAEQLRIAHGHVSRYTEKPDRIIAGLSPHAPYSVHPELFRKLIDLAKQSQLPVAMHLAETRAELELLADGTGEFAEMLRAFGVWSDDAIPRGSTPLDYLHVLVDAPRALIVHGNYLTTEELDFIAGHPQLTLVYCPRTHAYFGHSPHTWQALLSQRNDAVALGTDSRASNPDLDLWGEVLFLKRQFPQADPALLLQLATLNGAHALGLEETVGSLSTGKQADIAVVALPEAGSGSAFSLLFDSSSRVVSTMCQGRWLVRL